MDTSYIELFTLAIRKRKRMKITVEENYQLIVEPYVL
jgi:hypothetical protein